MDRAESELLADCLSHALIVARQHNGILYTELLELRYRGCRIGLELIVDNYMTEILRALADMDNGARHMAIVPLGARHIHELAVADKVGLAVNNGLESHARVLGYLAYAALVYMTLMRRYYRLADGMSRIALRGGGNIKKMRFGNIVRMNRVDGEGSLGQRSGLVEYDRIYLRERLHIISALYKYAFTRGSAYAAEE